MSISTRTPQRSTPQETKEINDKATSLYSRWEAHELQMSMVIEERNQLQEKVSQAEAPEKLQAFITLERAQIDFASYMRIQKILLLDDLYVDGIIHMEMFVKYDLYHVVQKLRVDWEKVFENHLAVEEQMASW